MWCRRACRPNAICHDGPVTHQPPGPDADERIADAVDAFGGTAVTQSGDLLGTIVHKKGAPSDVSVVIDQVAP